MAIESLGAALEVLVRALSVSSEVEKKSLAVELAAGAGETRIACISRQMKTSPIVRICLCMHSIYIYIRRPKVHVAKIASICDFFNSLQGQPYKNTVKRRLYVLISLWQWESEFLCGSGNPTHGCHKGDLLFLTFWMDVFFLWMTFSFLWMTFSLLFELNFG